MELGKALLVEDDALVALLAQELLADAGFAVMLAPTGHAGVTALGAPDAGFTLAMVDMGLPDISGDVVVARLREIAPDLPVIIATGYSSGEIDDLFAKTPKVVVLHKPYNGALLSTALRTLGFAPNI